MNYLNSISNAYLVRSSYWDERQEVHDVRQQSWLDLAQIKRKQPFLKCIPENHWERILKTIKDLSHVVSAEEIAIFQEGRWNDPIFEDTNWIYFAFQAYLQDRIDEDRMCLFFLYYDCLQEETTSRGREKLEAYQLFDRNGLRNADAVACLRKATLTYLNDEQFERFLKECQVQPPEKLQFFSAPIHSECQFMDQFIKRKFTYTIFNLLLFLNKRKQMIASPFLIYKIHRVKFGDQAIFPVPSLGFNPKPKLSDPLRRIVFIPSFPGLAQEKIHDLFCRPFSIYYHDICYHHTLESANPHRPIWIKFAKFVNELEQDPELFQLLLDREFPIYVLPPSNQKASIKFWKTFAAIPYPGDSEWPDWRLQRDSILFIDRHVDLLAKYEIDAASLNEAYHHMEEKWQRRLKQLFSAYASQRWAIHTVV